MDKKEMGKAVEQLLIYAKRLNKGIEFVTMDDVANVIIMAKQICCCYKLKEMSMVKKLEEDIIADYLKQKEEYISEIFDVANY